MSNGFVVDYEGLMNLGQQLANLRGEFSKGSDAIGPLLGTISDSGLRGALDSFTTNWSWERAKLTENLNKAAGFAVEAATVYQKTDVGLKKAMSGHGG